MDNNFNISETIPHTNYVGDGAQTVFCFHFMIFEPGNMTVYLNGERVTSGFQVEISESSAGGNVIFAAAPAQGVKITLVRDLTIHRVSDFQEGGEIRTKALNHEFNYQMACTQQIADALNRTIIAPPYENTNYSKSLPSPVPHKALVWNQNADGLTNSAFDIGEIENQLKTTISELDSRIVRNQVMTTHLSTVQNNITDSFVDVRREVDHAEQLVTDANGIYTEFVNALKIPLFAVIGHPSPAGIAGSERCDGHLISADHYPDFFALALTYKSKADAGESSYQPFGYTEETYAAALAADGRVCGCVINETDRTVRLPTLPDQPLYPFIICANLSQPVSTEAIDRIHTELDLIRHGDILSISETAARTIPGNRFWYSDQYPLTENKVATVITHNLHLDTPQKIMSADIRIYAVCQTAEHGYNPGDIAPLFIGSNYLGRLYQTCWDITADDIVVKMSDRYWVTIPRGGLNPDIAECDRTKWKFALVIKY